ncbi:hypothetical protein OJF2_31200 [Aquisphaera giovannonii]|uniref:GAF domain-containing protein n=1 Tax=Aquisphaera giovannonii TaxID=406548 RepID=A0A5B9W2W1_9BACT|nr:hypothetical protein [Aquisphaera giovannonii]QEH34579.1 hypothetical protein OJF2_31200 [Aquisphaera giovannonii]
MLSFHDEAEIAALVARLSVRLGARAAGCWALDAGACRLVQVAFVSAPSLDREVHRAFQEATRSVPLDRADLGIVAAASGRRPAVSRAAELPPDAGSGYWLRAFGAELSMAIPILAPGGDVLGVVSIAISPGSGEAEALALERLLAACGPMASLLAGG